MSIEQEPPFMPEPTNEPESGNPPTPEMPESEAEIPWAKQIERFLALDVLRVEENNAKILTATRVTTGREKAVAASHLRNTMIATGFSEETAGDVSLHELKHGLKDKGKPGNFGFTPDHNREPDADRMTVFFYEPIGHRTFRERYESTTAPGEDMSQHDKIMASIYYVLSYLDPVIEYFRRK